MTRLILPEHFKPYEDSIRFINNNYDEDLLDRPFESLVGCFLFASDYVASIESPTQIQKEDKPQPDDSRPTKTLKDYEAELSEYRKTIEDLRHQMGRIIDKIDGFRCIQQPSDEIKAEIRQTRQDLIHLMKRKDELRAKVNQCLHFKDKFLQHATDDVLQVIDDMRYHLNQVTQSITNLFKTREASTADFTYQGHWYELREKHIYKDDVVATEADLLDLLKQIPLTYLAQYLVNEFPLEPKQHHLVYPQVRLVFLNQSAVRVSRKHLLMWSSTYALADMGSSEVRHTYHLPLHCCVNATVFLGKLIEADGAIPEEHLDLIKDIEDFDQMVKVKNYLGIDI